MNGTDAEVDVDVDELAQRVRACPSVASLAPGTGVEVATYLPGRRVRGVRVVDGGIEVHVVARYGRPLPEVAEEVRQAVGPCLAGQHVAVFIDDVDLGPIDLGPPGLAPGGGVDGPGSRA